MAYTNVQDFDDALAALNGARWAFRPDFCLIHLDENKVCIKWGGGGQTREINSATTVTYRAQQTINEGLKAEPSLRLIEDHKGDWVAIRTA